MLREHKEWMWEQLENMPVIDTHEHLMGSNEKRERYPDFFAEYLRDYLHYDLLLAGMSAGELQFLMGEGHVLSEKWELFEKYWRFCRHTGYGSMIESSIRILYGIDGIRKETIGEINAAVMKDYETDLYEKVLRQICHVETALTDNSDLESDRRYFRCSYNLDYLIFPLDISEFRRAEDELGRTISSFSQWLEAVDRTIERAATAGAPCFKVSAAYRRPLRFERTDFSGAEKEFGEMLLFRKYSDWLPAKPLNAGMRFSNYVMHHILAALQERDIPVQFHTGQLSGTFGTTADSNPEYLADLLREYPSLKFDLFHMGYPYSKQLISLCKTYPNAYFDFCWGYVLSPDTAEQALKEGLTTIPLNKIFGFGGDQLSAGSLCGHMHMAKKTITKVFAELIEEEVMDRQEAKWAAKRILYDNPGELYRLF